MSNKNGTSSSGKPDLAALRAEIAQTRSELGETVQALAAKADVKARAKERIEETKARVRAQAAEATDKMLEAAQLATGRVRGAAVQATDKARDTAVQARESGTLDRAGDAGRQVRENPIPLAAVLAGLAAVVGVILIVRGRRR